MTLFVLDVHEDWIKDLITSCWDENPLNRPSFGNILSTLKAASTNPNRSLVDSMIDRLEAHSNRLEVTVAERTVQLVEEKQKMEYLLAELLPLSVVQSLKTGNRIEPETFDEVSIFFSDVVSFTRISAVGTPIDVVRMLNLMYTVFDDIASRFDVYKVATIGDAYFVASGVPTRNGNSHASEICEMAVELLASCKTLTIPHIPDEKLKLRIGIHTGPCLAGVVGVKMPRYLLFGETIDIASMMESGGECMKIHVSQSVVDILPGHKFKLEKKEEPANFKGYGLLQTYWLDVN